MPETFDMFHNMTLQRAISYFLYFFRFNVTERVHELLPGGVSLLHEYRIFSFSH